jgi:hypothetical protein
LAAPNVHFDKLCLFGDAKAEKFGNSKCYDCKDPDKTQTNKNSYHRESLDNPEYLAFVSCSSSISVH